MPLPLILGGAAVVAGAVGGAAVVAGAVGVGGGIRGGMKMKEANDTMKSAKKRHEDNIEKFEKKSEITITVMDKLGKLELEILNSFREFSYTFEMIKNRPVFEQYYKNSISIPQYDKEELKEVSVGAGIILGGVVVATAGTIVGGLIFNVIGQKLSDKADEAYAQMIKAENQINSICSYLDTLENTANDYLDMLKIVNNIYKIKLSKLSNIVNVLGHTDWNTFTNEEKKLTENTVLLVGLLYNMCKVNLVIKAEKEDEINKVNSIAIEESIIAAQSVLADIG